VNATATTEGGTAPAETLEVVLAFASVEEYRAMGADLVAVQAKLKLPKWATPTEVIAAALQAAL
jgi:hypothetical protein